MTGKGAKMVIVGLDLSLTGTGMARLDESKHETWNFGTKPEAGTRIERSMMIAEKIRANSEKTDLFFIEDYAYSIKPKQSSLVTLGELGGIVKLVLWRWTGRHPTVIGSGTIKKWISGSGVLRKDMIPVAVFKKFKVDLKTHDEHVAYGLADLGLNLSRSKPVRELYKYEVQILKDLRKDGKGTEGFEKRWKRLEKTLTSSLRDSVPR